MRRILVLLFIFIIFVFGISFTLLNLEMVKLKYYFDQVEVPLPIIMVSSFALGAAAGMLASLGITLRLKREIVKLEKVKKLAEKEVANLRALPIKEKH